MGSMRRTGTVTAVEDRENAQLVTVRFEYGVEETITAPAMILIEAGSSVTETDTQDGKPVYHWG
jgi:hypothetical protein